MNTLELIQQLIKRPKHAFQIIESEQRGGLIPYCFLLLAIALFWLGYLAMVDQTWLHEHTVNTLANNVSPAEREQIAQGDMLKYNALIGSFIVLTLQGLILAAILNLFTKIDESNTDNFKDWLGNVWWTQLPAIPQLLLALLVMFVLNDPQTLHTDLFVTSINNIINLDESSPFYAFAAGLDVFSIWSYLLLFYLIATRTNLSTQLCFTISLLPAVTELCISYIAS
ncbi:YIP1 family protein [Algibacillus agarilyticus]|uniref:YIP1 family protein n=1 Tax=Algibacillus agarilyticus TaxID=2234133 RepID=UPI0013008F5F|nr:YIP1 family protein [Algibacillus agarilyticus]